MEVDDAPNVARDDFLSWFELSSESFPWREPIPRDIEMRRAHMFDVLIFDILLTSGGIRHAESVYPPTDVEGLRSLLDAIENSTYDRLKKDCLVYFLLKWYQDGREDKFMEERCIPPQFAALASAYWHLDSGIDVPRAVSMLSDARLNRDYPSKVLQALSLADDSHALIRKYVQTAKPLLTEPVDIDTYTVALAESSLMEAWQFQRTFAETSEMRPRLVSKILDWCLAPKPRSTPSAQLVSFPFSVYEQSLVHAYAMKPPSHIPASSIHIIHDLVCVRLIQSGQHAAAIKLDRQLSAASTQGKAPEGLYKAAQERKQMMDELMALMPTPERLLLEIELENLASGKTAPAQSGFGTESWSGGKSANNASDMDASMSMSWEHVSRSMVNGESSSASVSAQKKGKGKVSGSGSGQAQGQTSTPHVHTPIIDDTPILPISQRSGAPRFGGPPPNVSLDDIFSSSTAPSHNKSGAASIPSGPSGFSPGFPSNASRQPLPSKPSGLQNGTAPYQSGVQPGAGRSLFEIKGSANQTPNAFYQPPSTGNNSTAGVKRAFGQDSPRAAGTPTTSAAAFSMPMPTSISIPVAQPSISAGKITAPDRVEKSPRKSPQKSPERSPARPAAPAAKEQATVNNNDDVEMHAGDEEEDDDDVVREAVVGPTRQSNRRKSQLEETIKEFTTSVFGPSSSGAVSGARDTWQEPRRTRLARTETQIKQPPGAFFESEYEQPAPEPARSSVARERTPVQSRPPPRPTTPPTTRRQTRHSAPKTRAKAVGGKDLGRSIPGSLMDDDDDDDDDNDNANEGVEEEDVVPPLPATRRSTRKPRPSVKSVGALDDASEEEQQAGPVRRSSRRATMNSSVGSSSPEPVTPRKTRPRKSTRQAASGASTGAGAATRNTRKKRT